MQAPAVAAADHGVPSPQPAPALAPTVPAIAGGPAGSTAAVLRRPRLSRFAHAPAGARPVPLPLRARKQRRWQARIPLDAVLQPSDLA